MLSYTGHESDGPMVLTAEEVTPGVSPTTDREWLYRTVADRVDPRFVVDLGAVPFMASADIGVLITLKRRIDARKGKLVLACVDSYVVDALRVMRVDTLFTIAPNLTRAVELCV